MGDRKKVLFERKLKDDPIAYDVLNRPLVEGDFIIYACQNGHRTELRVAKILEAMPNNDAFASGDVKVKIQRCEKKRGWMEASREWELKSRPSFFQRLDNSYWLEEPPQEILDLFDGS